jgi:O-antigen/teichoic acid export membrane protein
VSTRADKGEEFVVSTVGGPPPDSREVSAPEVRPDPAVGLEEPSQQPGGPSGSRKVLRSVGANVLARVIALPVSALLGIAVTRLLVEQYGAASYAQYALVVGIGSLLPFADLGLGAAIVNATAGARDPRHDDHLRLTLISCYRLLAVSAAVVVLLSAMVTALGAWEEVLGDALAPEAGAKAAALCVAVLGLTLTVSVGQRILAGLGKYTWVIVIEGFQTPIVLAVLLMMITLDVGTGVYLAVVAYVATFFLSAAALVLAHRLVRPSLVVALRDAPRIRTVRGAKVFDTAWPMLIQMVAVALAMQSDRLVLSHVSDIEQLAKYSLAAQMFNPVVAVVVTASMTLWPVFAKARAEGVESDVSPMRMAALFGAAGAGLAVLVSLASGILSELAADGQITLQLPLLLAFSAFVVLQAIKCPLGIYLTDAKGLRFQAYMISMMLPVNVAISWVLAQRYGAAGPVIGSAVGVLLFEVVANSLYIRRHAAQVAVR